MKKSLLVISVILLIAGLFISCNSEAAESGEDLVYVKFADEGKGLSTVIAPFGGESATPIGNLYWYYQATKNGGAQQGATNGWTRVNNSGKGLSGTLGPFSVGSWTFTLKGCNDEAGNDIVYNGTTGETPIKLKRGTNYINVTLSWNNAPEAPTTTSFNWNVTYSADYSGTLYYRVTAKVGDTVTALNDGNSNSATITDGSISISGSKNNFSITDEFTPITVKFEVYSEAPVDNVYDEDVKVAENSVTFPGLKGGTATITGTLDDLGSAYVVINEPSTPEGIPASAISGVNSDTVAYIIKGSVMYGFNTLETAIEAADEGDTVGLLKDVNLSSMLQINKSITLDGNSHTINSSVGNTSIAILFYYGGAYYGKENTFYDNPDASNLENMELATPVVNNLSVSAPDAKYGIVFEGFVNATISNTDVTSNVTADGCGVTICGFNDTTGKTSLYQSFLTADNLRTNTNSGLDADWKNVGVSSQMYGVLSFNSGSSYAQGNGRAIGSYSSPSTSIISSGTFTGKIVAMQTTTPYNNSKYYSYDTENHKYTLNESSVVEHNVIQITGGTFTNTSFVVEPQTSGYIGEIIITGGTFDANPSDYVPEGYHATGTSGTWTVSAN